MTVEIARASIMVHKPPAEVLNAFVDPNAMSQFWFTRRDSGLVEGESATWALGDAADAFEFAVQVKELSPPNRLVVEWPRPEGPAQICWTCEAAGANSTVLTIEESGFVGDAESVAAQVLDSTGGFNQVIVAAKAWLEHGSAINVVKDHAPPAS